MILSVKSISFFLLVTLGLEIMILVKSVDGNRRQRRPVRHRGRWIAQRPHFDQYEWPVRRRNQYDLPKPKVCYFEAIPANECPSDASNLPKCMVAWDDDCKLQNMIDGDLCAHDLSVISPIIVQRYQDKNALGSKSCNGYNVLRYAGDCTHHSDCQEGRVCPTADFSQLVIGKCKKEVCKPKDNDACLQSSDGWSTSYTCENSKGSYCESWAKDMRRCCPESCKKENPENTLKFTEEDCNKFPGDGTCTYPNKAQCTDV